MGRPKGRPLPHLTMNQYRRTLLWLAAMIESGAVGAEDAANMIRALVPKLTKEPRPRPYVPGSRIVRPRGPGHRLTPRKPKGQTDAT